MVLEVRDSLGWGDKAEGYEFIFRVLRVLFCGFFNFRVRDCFFKRYLEV